MGNLWSVLYLSVFLMAGFSVARRFLPNGTLEETTVFSAAFGLLFLSGLPALFALFLGFTLPSAIAALFCAGIIAAKFFIKKPPRPASFFKVSSSFWLCVLPCLLFTVYLLHTHTLYEQDGGYWCGQSTYGDLPMHLAFIKGIAEQITFPPNDFLVAGHDILGYPFLCETVSSVFLLLGTDLKFACILPQVIGLFSIFGGGWLLAKELTDSHFKANLSYWLFFMGSGFGFLYFLGGPKGNFTRIFTAYYETPTNYVQENIRWVNPIADLLVPQRATLFGWAILFPCLMLLARFALKDDLRLWPALALLPSCLPLMQTHSALALVLISIPLFLRALLTGPLTKTALLPWISYAAVSAVFWIPQFFGVIFRQTSSGQRFLQLGFNWSNEGDNYFWFYIKNIGLVYLFLIPAFLWAGKKLRWMYSGGLLILALSEFIIFQPNPYDNNKLLFIWHLLGCILVGNFLVEIFKLFRKKSVRVLLCSAALFIGTFGSVLTLGREAVSQYQHFNADAIATGAYVDENTDPSARFLTGMQLTNPIFSLAGRPIMCAASTWVYYHGLDYAVQEAAIRQMYESPSEELLASWDISYAMISNSERSDYAVNEDWFMQHCTLVFEQGDYRIYQV